MNTPAIITPAEVIDPKQSANILARCEKQIDFAIEHLKASDRISEGWRFLVGAQMLAAKPHLPHGNEGKGDGFRAWVEKRFPTIEERTATNYLKFASTILAVAPKLKMETVSIFKQLPEKLRSDELTEPEQKTILQLVPEVTKGAPMMQFIKEQTPKPDRKIEFPCPHCGHANKGIVGREITCANKECGETIKVTETETPEQMVKAMIQQAEELVTAAVHALRVAREHEHAGDVSTDALSALRDECIEAGKAVKALLKKRKAKKAKKTPANELRKAIADVVQKKPMTVRDIATALVSAGIIGGANPINTVGKYLYGEDGRKHFTRGKDGGFQLRK